MLKSLFDAVMERRASQLTEQVSAWLPKEGPVLDLGSGTGHVSARLERELGLEVVTADVSDIHVVGRPPVLIGDGALPFQEETFSAALLLFMLAYPSDPAGVLAEAARVCRGPIIVVQSLHSNRLGYAWLRGREFIWTIVAFHVAKIVGYVPRGREVHDEYPPFLYRPGTSARCAGGRVARALATGAAAAAWRRTAGGRLGFGTRCLRRVFPS